MAIGQTLKLTRRFNKRQAKKLKKERDKKRVYIDSFGKEYRK